MMWRIALLDGTSIDIDVNARPAINRVQQMSAITRQKYAAEMTKLREQRAQLRKTFAAFWVQIGRKTAQ